MVTQTIFPLSPLWAEEPIAPAKTGTPAAPVTNVLTSETQTQKETLPISPFAATQTIDASQAVTSVNLTDQMKTLIDQNTDGNLTGVEAFEAFLALKQTTSPSLSLADFETTLPSVLSSSELNEFQLRKKVQSVIDDPRNSSALQGKTIPFNVMFEVLKEAVTGQQEWIPLTSVSISGSTYTIQFTTFGISGEIRASIRMSDGNALWNRKTVYSQSNLRELQITYHPDGIHIQYETQYNEMESEARFIERDETGTVTANVENDFQNDQVTLKERRFYQGEGNGKKLLRKYMYQTDGRTIGKTIQFEHLYELPLGNRQLKLEKVTDSEEGVKTFVQIYSQSVTQPEEYQLTAFPWQKVIQLDQVFYKVAVDASQAVTVINLTDQIKTLIDQNKDSSLTGIEAFQAFLALKQTSNPNLSLADFETILPSVLSSSELNEFQLRRKVQDVIDAHQNTVLKGKTIPFNVMFEVLKEAVGARQVSITLNSVNIISSSTYTIQFTRSDTQESALASIRMSNGKFLEKTVQILVRINNVQLVQTEKKYSYGSGTWTQTSQTDNEYNNIGKLIKQTTTVYASGVLSTKTVQTFVYINNAQKVQTEKQYSYDSGAWTPKKQTDNEYNTSGADVGKLSKKTTILYDKGSPATKTIESPTYSYNRTSTAVERFVWRSGAWARPW